jgi:hypothetical protein
MLNHQFGGDSAVRAVCGSGVRFRLGGGFRRTCIVARRNRKESHEARRELSRSIDKELKADSLLSASGLGKQVCYAARPYNFVIGADGQLMKCTVVLGKEDFNIVGRLSDDGNLLLDVDKMVLWIEPAGMTRAARVHVAAPARECCPLVRMETQRLARVQDQLRKELFWRRLNRACA